MQMAEGSVAVASAVQSLRSYADIVTGEPGPAGVLEALLSHWLVNGQSSLPSKHSYPIPLGQDEAGVPVSLPSSALVGANLGIFGDPGHDAPLPKQKRFYFRTDKSYLGIEAASLFKLKMDLQHIGRRDIGCPYRKALAPGRVGG